MSVFIPDNAPARRLRLLAGDEVVAEETLPGPGEYTIRSKPFRPASRYVAVALDIDRTFRANGDDRDLGVVLKEIGFK